MPESEYADPLTERKMARLTDPDILCHLPHFHHTFVGRRNDFVLLAGEFSGSRQLYEYDLGRGRLTQLTDGPGFLPYSATFDARERVLYFLRGAELVESGRGRSERSVYRSPDGWSPTGHLTISSNSRLAALIEMKDGHRRDNPREQHDSGPRCRLRVVDIAGKEEARTLVEEDRWLAWPQFRPGGTDLLYAHEGPWSEVRDRLRLVALDGRDDRALRPRDGSEEVGQEQWSADGSRVYFVHFPDETGRRASVREIDPQSGVERTLSPCSAFGWMRVNADASAIVGASRRASGPNVYILFPKLQREITLCEHSSSRKPYPFGAGPELDPDAAHPSPVLSPDSQWVYFTSDKDGKPAVYRMKVDDLVSET